MKRSLFLLAVLGCGLAAAPGAVAAPLTTTGTITQVAADGSWFQIRRPTTAIEEMVVKADAITRRDYPYVYAGGHVHAGTPSAGFGGPGRVGYDCSGSIAAVLAAGGLWRPGSAVPGDAEIVAQLRSRGLIVGGAGAGSPEITLYAYSGVHIFMRINGRYFGTSDGRNGNHSQPHGGAGWLNDGAPDASSPYYKRFHIRLAVLRRPTSHRRTMRFMIDPKRAVVIGYKVGQRIRVRYVRDRNGLLVARGASHA